jgi:hypothetical protein
LRQYQHFPICIGERAAFHRAVCEIHVNRNSRLVDNRAITAKRNVDMFKFGFNYKFGGWGGPVAGPY